MIGHYLDLLIDAALEPVSEGSAPPTSTPVAGSSGRRRGGDVSFSGPMVPITYRAESRLTIRILFSSRSFLELMPAREIFVASSVRIGLAQKAQDSFYDHLPAVLAADEEWFLTIDA